MALNMLHPNGFSGPTTEPLPATKATQAEAVAGVDNRKYMTPLRTKQVLDVVVEEALPGAITSAMAQAGAVFDDVLSVETLPQPGVSGKLYIVGAIAYHWNGTDYDQIGLSSTDELSEGTTNLFYTDARVALAPSVSGLGTRMDTAETNITDLQTTLGGIAGAFNYVGTLTGGEDSASATDLSTLLQKDAGDYYKVTTAGYFIIAPDAAFYANVGDGLVFNKTNGVDKIDNTNSSVAGTAEFVSVSGSQDTGYTVDLDATFKTRITNLENGKQIKDVVGVTAPAHSAGLRWIDPTDMSEYLSYNDAWVELDKQ